MNTQSNETINMKFAEFIRELSWTTTNLQTERDKDATLNAIRANAKALLIEVGLLKIEKHHD